MSFLSAEKKEELKPGQIVWIIPDFKNSSIVWQIPVIRREADPDWWPTCFKLHFKPRERYKLGIEYAAGESPKDYLHLYRNRDEIYDTQEEALKALEKILLSERDKINKQYEKHLLSVAVHIDNIRKKLKVWPH